MEQLDLGTKIRELRKQKQLTQRELGELINVTDKAISKWERGNGYPDMATIPLLAKALDVSPSVFFIVEEQEEMEKPQQMMENTLEYARKVEGMKSQSRKKIAVFTVVAANFIAIWTCFIVGWSIGQTDTWMPISIASIVYGLLVTLGFLLPPKKAVPIGLAVASVITIPYLWILSCFVAEKGWFLPIALPITLLSICIMWIGYLLLRSRLRKPTAVAILLLFTPVVNLAVDLVLGVSVAQHFANGWEIFTLTVCIFAAATVFFIGKLRRKPDGDGHE